MFVFKVKKFKKCSAVHKVKGKRVLLALSSIHSTWAYFSAEILSRLLCLYVMHEGHFLLFTADAQFIHILKKKRKERNLSSLSLTSSSSIKSGPRLHHLLHLFHQHLKSCSQYLLFLQRLVKSMNGEVVEVARLLCFSLSSNFFSMALPLLMSFFSSSFPPLPSYSKDQLSSIPVKVF